MGETRYDAEPYSTYRVIPAQAARTPKGDFVPIRPPYEYTRRQMSPVELNGVKIPRTEERRWVTQHGSPFEIARTSYQVGDDPEAQKVYADFLARQQVQRGEGEMPQVSYGEGAPDKLPMLDPVWARLNSQPVQFEPETITGRAPKTHGQGARTGDVAQRLARRRSAAVQGPLPGARRPAPSRFYGNLSDGSAAAGEDFGDR